MSFVTRNIIASLPESTIFKFRKFTIRTSSSSSSSSSSCNHMRWNTLNKVNNPLVLRSGNIGTTIPNSVSTSTNRIPNTIANRVATINSNTNTNSNRITCWRRWNSNNSNNANHRSAPKTGTPKTGTPKTKTSNTAPNANHNNPKTSTTAPDKASTSFLTSFLAPKQMPPRYAPRWYAEMALLCTVFGITGTSTMVLVRPAVSDGLGLRGTMKEGPWSYRVCSLVIMTPVYAAVLVVVGTVFGRHAYFRHFSVKMFSRFGVPPELMDRNFRKNAENFRKW